MTDRYRREGGRTHIDIRVRTTGQLFDARDPAPFRERDLDDELVEYLVSSANELSLKTPLTLTIHIGQEATPSLPPQEIKQAFATFFEYEAELKRMQLRRLFRTGQVFFVIGIFSLFAFLGLAGLTRRLESEQLRDLLREGLVICGWVAMWRPLELVLYDWWPLGERMRLFRKLAKTPVEIVTGANGDGR